MFKYISSLALMACFFILTGCGNPGDKTKPIEANAATHSKLNPYFKQLMEGGNVNPFSITLTPEKIDYYIPALHSYANANYNGQWIIMGGQTGGFHGTSNNPPPFLKAFANDSIWVIDAAMGQSYSVVIPPPYRAALSATSTQCYQSGNDFYVCGGYTVSDSSQTRFNTTSNYFFKINLQNLITYVKSGGANPGLSDVFPVVINNNFVRVSGGELYVENNNFYLVGGQDYNGLYSPGLTGTYTNAIRSFNLQQNNTTWNLVNLDSLVDPVNLHRRDFNLVPFVAGDNSIELILLGGVFTPANLSYNNPVYIKGLSTGKPSITVGTTLQDCNQYTSAFVPLFLSPGFPMMYGLLGGISYKKYDAGTGKLVIGDNGFPMPFSNLVDFMVTDGDTSVELTQTPPQALLPAYVGSNASFIPLPQYVDDNFENILDVAKIFPGTFGPTKIGYLYGGVLSNGPTSGTTPKGHVNTYANPVLYAVNFTFDTTMLSRTKPEQK